ncbi:hypothetical protein ABNF65_23975 [Paenibacillus larvae]
MIDKLVLPEYLDDLERKGYETTVILEFLKGSVDKRIEYVISMSEKEHEEEYDKFLNILTTLKTQIKDCDRYLLVELEDMYIEQNILSCSFAYKFCLKDILKLYQQPQELI